MKGTSSFGIFYVVDFPLSLIRYTNSNCAGDGIDRKSTFGYIFIFGAGTFCLSNKRQSMTTLSRIEYRGVVNPATQVVWL